jgi:hypothetical protein
MGQSDGAGAVKPIRIPGLVDLVRTDDPDEILDFARDPRLDRDFARRGPLLNRLVLGRIRRVLQLDGAPFPPVAPADYPGRKASQDALAARLAARLAAAPADPEALQALADYVTRRRGAPRSGPVAQQAVGRLFVPTYRATKASWRAAKVLDTSARSLLSPLPLLWRLTGRLARARRLLAGMVDGDRSGLHATGIAIHNLIESLERMRALAAGPDALRRYAPDEAASLCLSAPARIVRQARERGTVASGSFRGGTLVLLGLEAARARSLRHDMAFMTRSWSRCPADRWVPAFLAAVWAKARDDAGAGTAR